MTDSEKLARWQGYKQHPNGVSCYTGELRLIGGALKWPDYPNDAVACDSLLDTLVEKDYDYAVFGNSKKTDVRIYDSDGIGICMSIKPTRREAIISACLEVARKELDG
jgi:hypothetical protein